MTNIHELLTHLNQEQIQAVTDESRALLVFAGAGSGKTRVLTHRIAYALLQKRVLPQQILALTFTNKAAQEMSTRIAGLLDGTQIYSVGTFHRLCGQWLRENAALCGLKKDFMIYDTQDQKHIVKKVLETQNLDSDRYRYFIECIDQAKNKALWPQEFKHTEPVFYRVYAAYELYLAQTQAVDFGSLILKVVSLLSEHPQVKASFHARYRMILVDEYQDTNAAQYVLLRHLVSPHAQICVVGDDDQSIYRFRGSLVEHIWSFQKHFAPVNTVILQNNYRSTQAIVEVAQAVISHNTQRQPKLLKSQCGVGTLPCLHVHLNEYEEALWITQLVNNAKHAGVALSKIAILLRQNVQSRVLEEAFLRARIPVLLVGGQRFYERAEIKDLLAYLRLLINPQSQIDFLRAVNMPPRGIGEKSVAQLQQHAVHSQSSFFEIISEGALMLESYGFKKALAQKYEQFFKLIEFFKTQLHEPPYRLMMQILEHSGLRQFYEEEGSLDAKSRLSNLEEFIVAAQEWSLHHPQGDLNTFLENLALMGESDKVNTEQDHVLLMTVHSAKGLEFDWVIIPGLEEGVFPVVKEGMSKEDEEEERRLLYVAITRARHQLYLSSCQSRARYGQRENAIPSRFLYDIPPYLIALSQNAIKATHAEHSQILEDRTYSLRTSSLLQKSVIASVVNTACKFKEGQMVQHATFGQGKVLSLSSESGKTKATVYFDSVGPKTVITQYLE